MNDVLMTPAAAQRIEALLAEIRAAVEAHNATAGASQIDAAAITLHLPDYGELTVRRDLLAGSTRAKTLDLS